VPELADDAVSLTTYDDNDCVLSTTDDNGNSNTYTYDAKDRCVLVSSADGTHRTFTMIRVITPPNSGPERHDRQLHLRLEQPLHAQGHDLQFSIRSCGTTTFELFGYDGCSRLTLASNDVSRLTFGYDTLGNCASSTQDGLVTTRTYDGVGNCLAVTYPGGRLVAYTYDALDQVASVSSSATSAIRRPRWQPIPTSGMAP